MSAGLKASGLTIQWSGVSFQSMRTLDEIEAAVDALPSPQQEELFRHLAERLQKPPESKRRLPFVPATGHPISQEEIDGALDTD